MSEENLDLSKIETHRMLHKREEAARVNAEKHKGNMFNRKYKTPEELQEKIDEYFKDCEEEGRPLTITGLALAVDTDRARLLDYQNKIGGDYNTIITKAKLMCQNFADEFLFRGKNVAGAIFSLKNNYGWVDRKEIKQTGNFIVDLIKNADGRSDDSANQKPPGDDKE